MHTGQRFDHPAVVRRSSVGHDVYVFQSPKCRLVVGCILAGLFSSRAAVHTVQGQDDPYRGQRTPESQAKVDAQLKEWRSIALGRKQIQDVPAHSFVDLEFVELPKDLKSQMYNRLAFVLQAEVHPQKKIQGANPTPMSQRDDSPTAVKDFPDLRPGRMGVRAFAAYNASGSDLIEYSWEHEGLQLRALMAREVFRLDLELEEVRKAARAAGMDARAYLRHLIPQLVRLQGDTKTVPSVHYEVDAPIPGDLAEGIEFSSNPEKDLHGMDLYTWYERIDGFIDSGRFSLLFYMKPRQKPDFRDGSTWFPDDFRQLVHEKAREQGKLPPVDAKPHE